MAYLTSQELIDNHLPGDVAAASDVTDRTTQIEAASAEADGYLRRAGFSLPLTGVGADLKAAVGRVAAYHLAVKLGLLPEPAAQSALYLGYKTSIEWLRGVANGTITPMLVLAGDEEAPSSAPLVTSEDMRGW